MNIFKGMGIATAAIMLSGCATNRTFEGGRTWDAGWRKGVISSVTDELRWHQFPSCGLKPSAGDKFAAVYYRANNRPHWKFVPVAASLAWTPQSKVLLNVNTCELVRDA